MPQPGKTKAYPPLSGRETSTIGFIWLQPGESVQWVRDGQNNVTGYRITPAKKK